MLYIIYSSLHFPTIVLQQSPTELSLQHTLKNATEQLSRYLVPLEHHQQ